MPPADARGARLLVRWLGLRWANARWNGFSSPPCRPPRFPTCRLDAHGPRASSRPSDRRRRYQSRRTSRLVLSSTWILQNAKSFADIFARDIRQRVSDTIYDLAKVGMMIERTDTEVAAMDIFDHIGAYDRGRAWCAPRTQGASLLLSVVMSVMTEDISVSYAYSVSKQPYIKPFLSQTAKAGPRDRESSAEFTLCPQFI